VYKRPSELMPIIFSDRTLVVDCAL